MKKIFLFSLAAFTLIILNAQDNSIYKKKFFTTNNDTLQYRILYPNKYKAGKKYPFVLFLHGSGERGNDNELQLVHGSKFFADEVNMKKFPAIVIFPQCASNDSWVKLIRKKSATDSTKWEFDLSTAPEMTKSMRLVSLLLDSLLKTGTVNRKRIYVGGLSMGGMGTFDILWRKPHFFAAAFPICGAGNEGTAGLYGKRFPIWVFHGDADQAVDVNNSRRMVKALKAAGAKVKYSEYAGVGHNSWDNAFAEPDLLPWLFSQKKK